MTNFTIEIDHDIADRFVFENLAECRQRFLDDLGAGNSVFVWDDGEADDAEIQRHIDALDVVLSWYGTPHQLKDLYGE